MVGLVTTLWVVVLIMGSVAFFSLFERKMLGSMQYREGPNKVGVIGLVQPITDAMKLVSKEEGSPVSTISLLYWLAPMMTIMISLMVWGLKSSSWTSISSWSMMLVMIYFGMTVYGLMMMGWFSNSKYSVLGCVRATSQSISYEIGLTTSLFAIALIISSLKLDKVMEMQEDIWLVMPLTIMSVCFVITLVAETNRSPFDLAEAESELVSGFCIEYGGVGYTMIFLAENISLMWAVEMTSLVFFNHSQISVLGVIFMYVWLRGSQPRVRFDKVTNTFWVSIFPIILASMMIYVLCV